jgi:hypothetical protein
MSHLVAFINDELLMEDEIETVDADTPLLEMGILDSLAMVSLLVSGEGDLGVICLMTTWSQSISKRRELSLNSSRNFRVLHHLGPLQHVNVMAFYQTSYPCWKHPVLIAIPWP